MVFYDLYDGDTLFPSLITCVNLVKKERCRISLKKHTQAVVHNLCGLVNFYCVILTVFRGNQNLGANQKQVQFRNMFIFSFYILIYWILWSWAHTEM